jgi:predicted small secreted protein
MRGFKRLVVALVVGSLMSAGALGCNTVRGVGKDVQKGGQGIENAAGITHRK